MSHPPPIDLRSDTLTRPTPGMREAMARAEVGDDVYGEDPTVRLLEERIASLLGHEAALFFPSGTMANQAAIGSYVGPGQEVLCERTSHVLSLESGAMAALWGAQPHPIPGDRGLLAPKQIAEAVSFTGGDNIPSPGLLCLENTHNRGGGTAWPLAAFRAVVEEARRHRLPVHLDGARLWNAALAVNEPPAAFATLCDSVSVCLSKGLGAPAGSVVAASAARVATLRRLRRRLGGGMRQAGVLAAAGLYALDHHLPRLGEDHQNARRLVETLQRLRPELPLAPPETNIVFLQLPAGLGAAAFGEALRSEGVLVSRGGPHSLRLVTHQDVNEADCVRAAETIASLLP